MSTRPDLPAERFSLAGAWELRRVDEEHWRTVTLPAAWEAAGIPHADPGPYIYRKVFNIPAAFAGKRLWLRCAGVSYDCQVWVNGQLVGSHRGLWDPIELEISGIVQAGDSAELLLQVEKPAGLTAGPDSLCVPGSFPMRQTLSGFLPYVCGYIFGGIWQEIELVARGMIAITELSAFGSPEGEVRVQTRVDPGEIALPAHVELDILDPAGGLLAREERPLQEGQAEWTIKLPGPQPWSPAQPALYTASAAVAYVDGMRSDACSVRFGLKFFSADSSCLLLNGEPVYPRLILSWGWYPDRLDANPGPEQVRKDLLQLQAMGYNGVKLCLWFPPAYYFDLADELGMLLWVELPLWLPKDGPFFRVQTWAEYERLAGMARQHPSVVLYTLGCELARQVEQDYLAALYSRLSELALRPLGICSQALLCDNSGSGEAYGGWLDQQAQFYDHHFYCEPHFMRGLLKHFAPGWRPPKPWLMGEFCDYDTLRPLPALLAAHRGKTPWWADADPQTNPQGGRWEMRLPGHTRQLQANRLWEGLEDLVLASHRQGLLQRKVTLEMVRAAPELSGYVVTGERDTPVSTAGMWDDLGTLKFSPVDWKDFNQDTVLCLGTDRRRAWVAGGDRPAFNDQLHWRAGDTFRLHLLVSHYGSFNGLARLRWQVCWAEQPEAAEDSCPPIASGECETRLVPGSLQAAGLVSFTLPSLSHPQEVRLSAELELPGQDGAPKPAVIHNAWPCWFYPTDPWAGVVPFGLLDVNGSLPDLPEVAGKLVRPGLSSGKAAVCTGWTSEVQSVVRRGGRVVLLQQAGSLPGPLPTLPMPFWREALKLAVPHPAWGDFPYQEPGMQFYSLAADCAFQAGSLPPSTSWKPLLRRLDTRSMHLHEYLLEMNYGRGQVLLTTLRLQGGLGDQPSTLRRSLAGQWLLACLLRYLQRDRPMLEMA